jgi:hypothetical protein
MGQDNPANTHDAPVPSAMVIAIAHNSSQDDVDGAEQFGTSLHLFAGYLKLGRLCHIFAHDPQAPCHVLLEACDDRDAAAQTILNTAGCAALGEEAGAGLIDEVRLLQRTLQKTAMISSLGKMLADNASDIFGIATSE